MLSAIKYQVTLVLLDTATHTSPHSKHPLSRCILITRRLEWRHSTLLRKHYDLVYDNFIKVSVMHLPHLYQEHLRCCDSHKQSSTLCLVQFKCISSSQVSLKYFTDHRFPFSAPQSVLSSSWKSPMLLSFQSIHLVPV